MFFSKQPSRVRTAILCVVCTFLIARFQLNKVNQVSIKAANFSVEEGRKNNLALKQRLAMLNKVPSLGFRNALANNIFLNFLQYFSDATEKNNEIKSLSPNFFEAIISLDPYYRSYYLFLSNSTTLYAGEPEKTVALMTEALRKIDPNGMPDSFYIWRYKGVDELLFLDDSRSAKKSFTKAAEWARRSDAPDSELVEVASQRTADFLKNDPESRYAQVAAWSSVLSNALDDDTRKRAVERIEKLGASVDVHEDGSVRINSIEVEDFTQTKVGS